MTDAVPEAQDFLRAVFRRDREARSRSADTLSDEMLVRALSVALAVLVRDRLASVAEPAYPASAIQEMLLAVPQSGLTAEVVDAVVRRAQGEPEVTEPFEPEVVIEAALMVIDAELERVDPVRSAGLADTAVGVLTGEPAVRPGTTGADELGERA